MVEKIFVSSLTMGEEEVKAVLQRKIDEENELVDQNISPEDKAEEIDLLKNLNYSNKIDVVSLFSGCGGLDLGVELASLVLSETDQAAYSTFENKEAYDKVRNRFVNFIYSNDIFEAANLSYLENFPKTVYKNRKNIQKIGHFPKSNLILGGFPCPGFSAAGPRLLDDPRNFLYIHYIRALMESQPEFFIAENVKGLMTMANGRVLQQITEDFSAAGYQVTAHLVNARDYGVPQLRERVFIIGVRKDIVETHGFTYQLPKPTHGQDGLPFVTLKDALAGLPLEAEDVFDTDYSSMYMSRNRKKSWEEQSFTIQASGRQAPQHPHGLPMTKIASDRWEFQGDFNRRLSVRECARIQTFPDWFSFSSGSEREVSRNHLLNEQYKQIGNAVPVLLAEKIARPIIEFLIAYKQLA